MADPGPLVTGPRRGIVDDLDDDDYWDTDYGETGFNDDTIDFGLDDDIFDVDVDFDADAPFDDGADLASYDDGLDPAHTSHAHDYQASGSPQSIRTRVWDFGKAHLSVVMVVCAVALVFLATRVMGATATSVDSPTPSFPSSPAAVDASASPASSASSGSPQPVESATPARLQVHVIGAVVTPGVVALPEGSRVIDALDAAGGLRDDADAAELNMAAEISDGSQIIIGTRQEPRGELRTGSQNLAPASDAPQNSSAGSSSALININTASASQLAELPGIGAVLSERIVEHRTTKGAFSRIEELQEVDGIGAKLYERIKDRVTV